MKRSFKLILVGAVIVFLIYFVAQLKLRAVLIHRLSKALNRQVYIAKVGLGFPFHAYLKNLIIFEPHQKEKSPDFFIRIEKIFISPSLLPYFKGRFLLAGLYFVRPTVNIFKYGTNRFNFSDLLVPKVKGHKKKLAVLISRLKIKNGEMNFIDQSLFDERVEFRFRGINFFVARVSPPLKEFLARYNFEARWEGPDLDKAATVESGGWLNFTKKDMEAKFSLVNLELSPLRPYYGKRIPQDIELGRLNLHSDITSTNNNLTAKCKLELSGLKVTQDGSSSQTFLGIPLENLSDFLDNSGGKLNLDFVIKTKFDKPRINFAQLSGSILSSALKETVLKSPGIILKIGEKGLDSSGPAGEGIKEKLKSIGEQLKKILDPD